MTDRELKYFFKKVIPAAHKSIKEAASFPEGVAKRKKVELAIKRIEQGFELLERCGSDWNPKYILLLSNYLGNVPIEQTANIFYRENDNNKVRKTKALIDKAISRMSEQLKVIEATNQVEESSLRKNMEQRLKARQQRGNG